MDIYTVLLYSFATIVTGFMLLLISMYANKGVSLILIKKMYLYWGISAAALCINFLYTAYLGFNHVPTTKLELTLDAVVGIIQLIGIILFYYTTDVARRELKLNKAV